MAIDMQTELAQPVYEISEIDVERQNRIASAWLAYDDEFVLPLKQMPGEADDNVITNRIRAVVERTNDFLFGKELDITVEEGAPEEAQRLIDATWGDKEARIPLLLKWGTSGSMAGQGFLRIVQNRDKSFRLVILDPCSVFVKTDPQDCETVVLYCIEYSCKEKQNGKDVQIFYREEISRLDPQNDDPDSQNMMLDVDTIWQIQHWTRLGTYPKQSKWIPAGEPYIWPYPFAPIFSNQNMPRPHYFWGYPDVTKGLIRLNDSLNFTLSNISRLLKIYGHPIIYSSGTGVQELDIAPGRIIEFATPDGKIQAVNITADIPSAQSFATNLRSDIDEQSGVPAIATGRVADLPQGQISGLAIKLMYMPLLLKTEKKRCLYGKAILDICQALFRMAGMSDEIKVTLNWQDPLPADEMSAINAALGKKNIGISDSTLQSELGYDPEEEAAKSQAEDERKMLMFSQGKGLPQAQGRVNDQEEMEREQAQASGAPFGGNDG